VAKTPAATMPPWLDITRLRSIDPANQQWRKQIGCADEPPVTFMPPVTIRTKTGVGYDYLPAAAICARCPVRYPCLAVWLRHTPSDIDRQTGTYVGGTTPTQRILIRRHMRRTAA